MAGWQFDIAFDPAALEAVDVTEGDFLKTDGGSTFFQSGSIDNAAVKSQDSVRRGLVRPRCDRHRYAASGEVQGEIRRRNGVGIAVTSSSAPSPVITFLQDHMKSALLWRNDLPPGT